MFISIDSLVINKMLIKILVGEASENDNDNLQIGHSGKSLGDETIDQQFGCDCDQTSKLGTGMLFW
jgi:hypothetical protein